MSTDLRTLLADQAARPSSPVDVDGLLDRVDRRRRGRVALGAAALLTTLVTAVGIVQQFAETSRVPVVDEVPDTLLEASLLESGALDRALDDVLRLDPDTDERLRGAVLAEVAVDADAVAVAADRAIGIRQGELLAILVDGEEVAAGRLAGAGAAAVTWWGGDALAFDADGTLWALDGRTLVGLGRDGEMTVVEDAVTPAPSPWGGVGLRITGTDVSVLVHDLPDDEPGFALWDFYDPLSTRVVPVVGDDPLAGVVSVEAPLGVSEAGPAGLEYSMGRFSGLTSELLVSTTVVGEVAAALDWSDLPNSSTGYEGWRAQSQVVAGTAASLEWFDLYDGSFLTVAREDGTSLAALVASGPHAHLSVSPDGAVHLVTRHEDGTSSVRTLLTGDLRPLTGPPMADRPAVPRTDPAADRPPPPPMGCRQLPDGSEVIDQLELDLDGDGRLESVAAIMRPSDDPRHPLLLGCFADGTGVESTFGSIGENVPGPDRLEPVELAGAPGVAGVRTQRDGHETFELAVLPPGERTTSEPGGRWFVDPMWSWAPALGGGEEGTLVPLVNQLAPEGGRSTTFGCRSAADGRPEVVELHVGGIDEATKHVEWRWAYRGDDLEVTYVVHRIAEDWDEIEDSSPPAELTVANGVADPVELLDRRLGASWLCRP